MHPHFNNNNLVLWLLCIHRVMDVHPLLDGSTNQFMGEKRSRDLCLRCNHEACMDSLAGQKAILKVEVSCLREMPLQFNCCMPGCTKNVRSKGPQQHYKIPRCKTNVYIILLNFLQSHSKLTVQSHSKLTDVYFNGFIESSVCIHEILFYGAC